jgi:hypothetical protein
MMVYKLCRRDWWRGLGLLIVMWLQCEYRRGLIGIRIYCTYKNRYYTSQITTKHKTSVLSLLESPITVA